MLDNFIKKIKQNKTLIHRDLYYIVENANWSIMQDGHNIVEHLQNIKGSVCTESKYIHEDSIRHYGSFNVFISDKYDRRLKKKAINIVTCFHIVDGDPRAKEIKKLDKYVTMWHTSCMITKEKLIYYGVPEDKIVVIPLGIDLEIYKPISSIEERNALRKGLGIRQEQIVIGSFQKDGNGWEEGDTPKLIKGPDIFCDMVERLSRIYDVFVLLSGPARGYVKNRLEAVGIPYYHEYFDHASDVARLYPLIDVYAVTSREEGGPKAILESMACGVPVISTRVGMAPEIIDNGENGFLVDCEDVEGLVNAMCTVLSSDLLKSKFIKQGRITAEKYNMYSIAERYEKELYQNV